MLTKSQTDDVWRKTVEAKVRSLYFGELATIYLRQKQWIVAISFVLASGSAVAAFGEILPLWTLGFPGLIVAALTGYSIGFGLDEKVSAIAKLHSSWNRLADDYERLWNHWKEPGAEKALAELRRQARELSEAGLKAPYKPARMKRWAKHVHSSLTPERTVTNAV